MQRRELELPLLIGGATTSRQHTAVRIAPAYEQATVHVLDASRVVDVVNALLDGDRRAALDADNRADQERLRARPRARSSASRCCRSSRHARTAPRSTGGPTGSPRRPSPARARSRRRSPSCASYIDWSFFFHAWELKGRFPAILDDPRQGAAARDLYAAAIELLDTIESRRPARGAGRLRPLAGGQRGRRHRARRRHALPDAAPADRLRRLPAEPLARRLRRAGRERPRPTVSAHSPSPSTARTSSRTRYEADNDDYSSIMVKALADRLAEAFAEYLHLQVRRAWYAPDEQLDADDLAHERYRGIRPAFGYPACPDHSEKLRLFALLGAQVAGLTLTESCAMLPAAAVSGIYFAHPQARYFSVSRIAQDQLRRLRGAQGHDPRRGGAMAAPAALGPPDG